MPLTQDLTPLSRRNGVLQCFDVGDGGDDIGDQVIGVPLHNDPFIMLGYGNKGYLNTGGQLHYTRFKGEKFTHTPLGKAGRGKAASVASPLRTRRNY